MSTALLIKTDGSIHSVEPENGTDFQLNELQQFVQGFIEIIPIKSGPHAGKILVCNEEGKLRGLEPNFKVHQEIGISPSEMNDLFVGNILICEYEQVN